MNLQSQKDSGIGAGLRHGVLTVLALLYVLFADYLPLMLAGLVCLFFAAYISVRLLIWFQNDRFTPNRLRVGLTWAFIGFHGDTDEFDIRPVRVYFLLLGVLFAGLVLRPIFGWMIP